MHWEVTAQESTLSLVHFLKSKYPCFSLQQLRQCIQRHQVAVNGVVERFSSYKLKSHDQVQAHIEIISPTLHDEGILYEDEKLFVYNKPSFVESVDIAQHFHVHLVHRLDLETTGVNLFAKNVDTQKKLYDLFKKRLIKKEYLACVHGVFKPHAYCHSYMKKVAFKGQKKVATNSVTGDHAVSRFILKTAYSKCSLVACYPKTGRTHQLRIHLASLGHPIVADFTYGSRSNLSFFFMTKRILLHANAISWYDEQKIAITAPLPADFRNFLKLQTKETLC